MLYYIIDTLKKKSYLLLYQSQSVLVLFLKKFQPPCSYKIAPTKDCRFKELNTELILHNFEILLHTDISYLIIYD